MVQERGDQAKALKYRNADGLDVARRIGIAWLARGIQSSGGQGRDLKTPGPPKLRETVKQQYQGAATVEHVVHSQGAYGVGAVLERHFIAPYRMPAVPSAAPSSHNRCRVPIRCDRGM